MQSLWLDNARRNILILTLDEFDREQKRQIIDFGNLFFSKILPNKKGFAFLSETGDEISLTQLVDEIRIIKMVDLIRIKKEKKPLISNSYQNDDFYILTWEGDHSRLVKYTPSGVKNMIEIDSGFQQLVTSNSGKFNLLLYQGGFVVLDDNLNQLEGYSLAFPDTSVSYRFLGFIFREQYLLFFDEKTNGLYCFNPQEQELIDIDKPRVLPLKNPDSKLSAVERSKIEREASSVINIRIFDNYFLLRINGRTYIYSLDPKGQVNRDGYPEDKFTNPDSSNQTYGNNPNKNCLLNKHGINIFQDVEKLTAYRKFR